MPYAGDLTVPPLRESAPRTGSVGPFTTTETVTDEITVTLIAGVTYEVEARVLFYSSVADDNVTVNLREDDVAGTQLNGTTVHIPTNSLGYMATVMADYTAVASGPKTFVATGKRAAGSGNITCAASAINPSYMWVRQAK